MAVSTLGGRAARAWKQLVLVPQATHTPGARSARKLAGEAAFQTISGGSLTTFEPLSALAREQVPAELLARSGEGEGSTEHMQAERKTVSVYGSGCGCWRA